MAEEEIFGQVQGIAATAGNTTLDVILWIALLILLGAAVWAFLEFAKFKHSVRIRYLTKEGSFIIDDKAKRKEEDGVVYWSLLKSKMSITPPPKESINITKKGRLVAECYITEDNPEPVWLKDSGYDNAQEGFLPLTTQQRSLTVSRIRKANSRQTKTMWEQISNVVFPIAMVIVVAIPFVFYGDIVKAGEEAIKQSGKIAEQNAAVAEQNARILSVMAGKLESGDLKIEQNIPPNANTGGGQ